MLGFGPAKGAQPYQSYCFLALKGERVDVFDKAHDGAVTYCFPPPFGVKKYAADHFWGLTSGHQLFSNERYKSFVWWLIIPEVISV